VAGEGDGISGDLSRIDLAEPQPHQDASLAQPGEEPGLIGRLFRRSGERSSQRAADRRRRNIRPGERPVFRGSGPAGPQFRQGQVGGKLPAAVPDHPVGAGGLAGQPDGVPGDLIRMIRAAPFADQHAGGAQPGEELLLCTSPGGRGAHFPA
jgi:hypothetical protein